MGEIRIQDTGYVLPTNAGTQASSGNMANSGTVVTLKTVQFIPQLKRNHSNQPDIGSNTPSDVNLGSLENMKFQLRCLFNSTNSDDMANVKNILDMIRTNGYKLMWYQYTDATNEKNNGQLIYQTALNDIFGHQLTDGEKTKFSISDNFYHLHVHLFDTQQPQRGAGNNIIYTIKGVVLKVGTSTI